MIPDIPVWQIGLLITEVALALALLGWLLRFIPHSDEPTQNQDDSKRMT